MPGTIARWRRYSEIASILARHGLHELLSETGLARYRPRMRRPAGRERRRGEEFRRALEDLGPTFIKLGQFMSTRPDLVPEEYLVELSRLQDHAPPFPGEQAIAIVEEELGRPIGELFARFDLEPAASASLGQVHHAVLHSGEAVAVKVQRPGIKERIETDLAILHRTAHFLQEHSRYARTVDFVSIAEEFDRSLHEEMDYHQEESNTVRAGRNLAGFATVRVPQVYPALSSRRVLTLERIVGWKVTELPATLGPERRRLLGEDFIRAYLKMIGVDGFFHSDPHPGNVWLDEQERLVLMDFGMVARLDESDRERFTRLLLAFAEGNGERVAEIFLEIGTVGQTDPEAYKRDIAALVARYHTAAVENVRIGSALLEMTQAAYRHNIRLPGTAAMLGKAMLNADAVSRALDPSLEPVDIIRQYAQRLTLTQARNALSWHRLSRLLMETVNLVTDLPARLHRLAAKLSEDRFRFTVEVDRLDELLIHMRKLSNRLAFALIDAALIVGAALLAQVPARPGLTTLATAGFIVAALVGFYVLLDILITDRPPPKKK